MKRATFEVPTLADAVFKAHRIAPTKGTAFDLAAGLVVRVNPSDIDETVVIESTDTEVTFRQTISVLEVGDEPATWRIPSALLNGFMRTLPMGSGSTIQLAENGDGNIYFKSGKTKAKLRLIEYGNYPIIEKFDPMMLAPVPGFAQRLAQVAWATDNKSTDVLAGVHMDGEYLYGCDRQVLAIVPCKVPVDRPVTAPLAELSGLIKNTSEVRLRAEEHRLQIMPDDYTQATSILFVREYPDVRKLLKEEFTGELTVNCEALIMALERMLVLTKSERIPITSIEIAPGCMKLEMEAPDVGKIADELDILGGDVSIRMLFTPDNLKGALTASGSKEVKIEYGPTPLSPVRVTDTNQFMSLLMPRHGT